MIKIKFLIKSTLEPIKAKLFCKRVGLYTRQFIRPYITDSFALIEILVLVFIYFTINTKSTLSTLPKTRTYITNYTTATLFEIHTGGKVVCIYVEIFQISEKATPLLHCTAIQCLKYTKKCTGWCKNICCVNFISKIWLF